MPWTWLRRFAPRRKSPRPFSSRRRLALAVEALEDRALLSATTVQEIVPHYGLGGNPANLTDVNGMLYFTIADYTPPGGQPITELWRSDGTAAGTVHLRDFQGSGTGLGPIDLTAFNGALYFSGVSTQGGYGLWKSDGTPAGTVNVEPFAYMGQMTAFDGALYFFAEGGPTDPGPALWRSGGTAATTAPVADVQIYSPPVVVNGKLFFAGADLGLAHGEELWVSDGTPAGTGMVNDLNPGPLSSFPGGLTAVGNTLLFTAEDAHGQFGLWASDGTAAGTVRLPQAPALWGGNTAVLGDTLYYFNPGSINPGIWKSDGTPSGTASVTPIDDYDHNDVSTAVSMAASQGALYYLLQTAGGPSELWKSDGTAAGTVKVTTLPPTALQPGSLINVQGTLFFTASDTGNGDELWKSDGTVAGTVMVEDVAHSWGPAQLADVHGTLYFAVGNEQDVRLWKYDPAVGPTAAAGGPYTIYAGEPVTLNGLASTGTGALTYAWSVNGHSVQGAAGLDEVSPATLVSYGITGPGDYPVTLTVFEGTASSTSLADLIVRSPLLNVTGVSGTATEGAAFHGTLAKFTDPAGAQPVSTYNAQFDWGDGSSSTGTVVATPNGLAVTGSHTYAEEGTYTVHVSVQKGGGLPNTVTTTVKVAEAPIWAGRAYQRSTEGQAFAGTVATITDGNPLGKASEFTATIQWGDGTTTTGTVTQAGPGKFAIQGGHTYAAAGTYTVTVAAKDKGGSASTALSTFQVDDAPLTAVPQKTWAVVTPAPSQTVVAGFTDANPLATAGQFLATIDWGDGTTTPGTVRRAAGQPFFVVAGHHLYAKSGTYTVTTTIRDAGGKSLKTTVTLPAVVSGPTASTQPK